MNAVEDAVRQALAAHEVHDYDATDLLTRVRAEIESPHRSRHSTKPTGFHIVVAAAAVLVLVGPALWLWLPNERSSPVPAPAGQSQAAPSTTTDRIPTAPPGTKFVGYRNLMLALPGTWATAGSCGHRAHRILAFPTTGPVRNCPYFRRHQPAAVVAFRDSIVGPPALLGKTVPGGTIGGEQVLLTDVVHRGGSYEQTLAIPAEQFYVSVLAQRRALVNRIIESAQAVPAEYTAVPEVRGMTRPEAMRALSAASLSLGLDLPKRLADLGPVHIVGLRPTAGSVVPVGTRVRLRFG